MKWLDIVLGKQKIVEQIEAETENLRFDRKRLDKALEKAVEASGQIVTTATEYHDLIKKLADDFRIKEKVNEKVSKRTRKT